MANKYMNMLMLQYSNATGEDINSFTTEFNDWILERRKIGRAYLELLKDLGIQYNSGLLEVGKGNYDTLVGNGGTSTILTPYTNTFFKKDTRNIINGNLIVPDKLSRGVITGKLSTPYLIVDRYSQIATHNPYSEKEILNWKNLYDEDKKIAIGVFGNIDDLDRDNKIKMLKRIREELFVYSYFEEYVKTSYSYMYALVSSDKNIKSKKFH